MFIIYININDIKIHYKVEGEGKPVILLHGWGANLNTFNNISKSLSENFKVYSIDLPGFGESVIGLPLSIDEVTNIIREFVNKLEIDKPIILGHSYGGRIAITYASKYDVDKLVLVSSAGIKEKLNGRKKFKIKLYKFFKKYHIKLNLGSKDYKDADNVKKEMLVKTVNQDLRKYMNKINVPTLLLYGKNDMTTKEEMARTINKEVNNSVLIMLDDCGHFPYLDRPYYFLLILNSFLLGEKNGN